MKHYTKQITMLDYTATAQRLSQIGHKIYSLQADNFINADKFSYMLDSMLIELHEQSEEGIKTIAFNKETGDAVERLNWLNTEIDKITLVLNGIITSRKVWETMRFSKVY